MASTLVKDLHAVHLVAGHDYHFATRGRATPSASSRSARSWASAVTLSPRWRWRGSRFPPPTSVPWWPKGRWSGQRVSGPSLYPQRPGGPREEAGLHPGLPHGEPAAEGERPLPGQRGVCHQGHPGKWGDPPGRHQRGHPPHRQRRQPADHRGVYPRFHRGPLWPEDPDGVL